jgi:hypothetical protein
MKEVQMTSSAGDRMDRRHDIGQARDQFPDIASRSIQSFSDGRMKASGLAL